MSQAMNPPKAMIERINANVQRPMRLLAGGCAVGAAGGEGATGGAAATMFVSIGSLVSVAAAMTLVSGAALVAAVAAGGALVSVVSSSVARDRALGTAGAE